MPSSAEVSDEVSGAVADAPCPRPTRVVRLFSRLNIGGPSLHVILLTAGLGERGYETRLVVGREAPSEGNFLDLARARGIDYVQLAGLGREAARGGARGLRRGSRRGGGRHRGTPGPDQGRGLVPGGGRARAGGTSRNPFRGGGRRRVPRCAGGAGRRAGPGRGGDVPRLAQGPRGRVRRPRRRGE